MSKRDKKRFVKSVWWYLDKQIGLAYLAKDELNFDWYSDGQQAFWCALNNKPIVFVTRIKPL